MRDGETIKVKRFVFNRVPMECDDGASTVGDAGSPPPAMRVNDEHRFRGKFTVRERPQAHPHPRQAQG